jgi:hypothetical protein
MEAITKIATVNVVRSQRARWQSGHLAQEWRTRFPDLFDDDDLRLANSQPAIHFYEWLGAVVAVTFSRARIARRPIRPEDDAAFVDDEAGVAVALVEARAHVSQVVVETAGRHGVAQMRSGARLASVLSFEG